MRIQRLAFILLAVYAAFIGASPYYYTVFPIRVATHLIFTVAAAGWLIQRLRSGRGLPVTPLTVPLCAAVAVWALSVVTAQDARMAVESAWLPLMQVLIFFAIAGMFQRGRQRLVWEVQFLMAALTVVMAALQFGSYVFGWGLTPETRIGWAAAGFPPTPAMLYLPLGVSTWLAAYTAPLSLLAFAWSLTARQRDERLALRVLAAALVLVLIGTNSRGGLLALGVSVLVFGALQFTAPLRRRFGTIALIVPAGALIAVIVGVVLLIGRSEARYTGDQLRVSLWQSAIETTQTHPISGVGIGGFGRAARETRSATVFDDRLGTAHNALLNTAAETGLIGTAVLVMLAGVTVWGWWSIRRHADSGYRMRLDAALAALAGIALQSMVDTFTATPIVILIALLAATCTVPVKRLASAYETLEPLPAPVWSRAAGIVALGLVAGYGIFWIQSDRAQAAFIRSVRDQDVQAAGEARSIDPALRLYTLQAAYLAGGPAQDDAAITAAIDQMRAALTLEPTWDTGWLNLAALYERNGQPQEAIEALMRAQAINPGGAARFQIARLQEAHGLGSDADIVQSYAASAGSLPLSAFWFETELRREAWEQVYAAADAEHQMRLAGAWFPERVGEIDAFGSSAADAFAAGMQMLSAPVPDIDGAIAAFRRAAALDPLNGDYPIAVGRAMLLAFPDRFTLADIEQELTRAERIYPRYDSANAVRALAAQAAGLDTALVQRYRIAAVPPRVLNQNFEGVLFGGRTASFDLYPEMRPPGPGRAVLQPWYDAAQTALEHGDRALATALYRAILDRAPEETDARAALAALDPA